ncbi:hypothetical protein NP233_g13013 [Leucocoprinus birnbaumii]|uniref:BTB domain-containing protein n=1 Tax=Leucocoprinus birnbaumii TaxID=56174 RepID=A0AAD5VDJ6_9AGAR|nr:hypothetical protein NP233_g13013 [Leucocoprinus birnbaumii]
MAESQKCEQPATTLCTATIKAEPDVTPPPSPPAYIRDPDYYYHDGSCVFLVQNHLFRIHRSQLERYSEIFKDMFKLPQPGENPPKDGTSDENPVVVHDTVAEFQAMCWAIYAKPIVIVRQMDPETTDILRLVDVVSMAHKYDMPDVRSWAFDALNKAVGGGKLFVRLRSWQNVQKLLDFAHKCGQVELETRIQNIWCKAIEQNPKTVMHLNYGLDAGEQCNIRAFQGLLYYTYLRATGKFAIANPATTSINNVASFIAEDPPAELGKARSHRLHRGFSSLTLLRNQLDTPPALFPNPQCNVHATVCQPSWEIWWKEFLGEAQKGGKRIRDPGELFLDLQQWAMRKPFRDVTRHYQPQQQVPCHAQIKAQVCAMKKQFDDTLPSHFIDES